MGRLILRLRIDRGSRLREVRGHIRDEPQAEDKGHQADEVSLHHVTLRVRQHQREEVEQTGKGGQRQKLVAREHDGDEDVSRDEKEGADERRGMADDERRTHADMDLLTIELLGDDLFGLVGDRHQTVDEELRDARDELHHRTHRHTEEEHVLKDLEGTERLVVAHMSHGGDDHANDDTENQGLTEHAELLLQTLGIDVELVEARDAV